MKIVTLLSERKFQIFNSLINLLMTNRKDDLELIMYILYFIHYGDLPVLDLIN